MFMTFTFTTITFVFGYCVCNSFCRTYAGTITTSSTSSLTTTHTSMRACTAHPFMCSMTTIITCSFTCSIAIIDLLCESRNNRNTCQCNDWEHPCCPSEQFSSCNFFFHSFITIVLLHQTGRDKRFPLFLMMKRARPKLKGPAELFLQTLAESFTSFMMI